MQGYECAHKPCQNPDRGMSCIGLASALQGWVKGCLSQLQKAEVTTEPDMGRHGNGAALHWSAMAYLLA